jgi:hypothetical protein
VEDVRIGPVELTPVELSEFVEDVRVGPVELTPVELSPVELSHVELSPVELTHVCRVLYGRKSMNGR